MDQRESRWLAAVVHAAFFLLLGGALVRFLLRHPGEASTPWVVVLSGVLAALYVVGPVLGRAGARSPRLLAWLGLVVAVWMVLVVLAPSFAWCAVPLFFTGLRTLPTRAAVVLVAVLTTFVVAAQVRLADSFDPNLLLAPPAVAALATAVYVQIDRQSARQRALERRAGTLAERQRLAMELHDTLTQGLSSQQMLLQAAERVWESDPAKARTHVRTAASVTAHNLLEARRLVDGLAPADLTADTGLDDALRALAERETRSGLAVRLHVDGDGAGDLPLPVQSALLRIAQGALANVREHADARTAALTLTLGDDQAVLDVADDGHGFEATAARGSAGPDGRGHGLPAMRARARRVGGTLTIESAPGDGTVVSAAVPLTGAP
ncbi:sensor histidine kinase [Mumia sp. DW29H23]|uniref:sensor histidine kinase n=1 Tax=Mumia sp. DW29H23 TaxID=3421241 RepID=UPI003D68930D